MTGILLIDKPSGWTSSDVVAKLRGILHERRIGHAGTLDPMATGLLVVLVGRATRASEFAEAQDKRYLAGLRLGLETDTQDVTGTPVGGRPRPVTEAELASVLERFRGEIQQIPPMYSAIKVQGKKLYEIARRGGEIARTPRTLQIHRLELAGKASEDYLLDIHCSKGTYVRSLCHDIGQSLGCGACMSSLRRLASGSFQVEDAYSLNDVQQAADRGEADKLLLPVDSLFVRLPAIRLKEAEERRIRNGNPISLPDAPEGRYRIYGEDGAFLAVGSVAAGQLKTIKSFFEVGNP